MEAYAVRFVEARYAAMLDAMLPSEPEPEKAERKHGSVPNANADNLLIATRRICALESCGKEFWSVKRGRFCAGACKQKDYRIRHGQKKK